MIIGGIQGFESTSMILIGLIAIVTFSFSIIISYMISRSLEKLTRNIDEISKGKLDVQLEKSEIFEINRLTNSLNRVMASLKLAIHKVGVKKGEIFEETVKAKEEVEEKFFNLLDNISGWAWETDNKGVYTFVSKNISGILGYKPEEVVGKNIFDFKPSDESKKIREFFFEAGRNKETIKNLENWNQGKKGKVCMITNAVPFYDSEGKLQGFHGVDIDITRWKNAEEKIGELTKEITSLREKIDNLLNERQKLKSKKLFTSGKKIEDKWSENEFDSVCLFDEQANIIDCNENMYKNLGYSKSEILSFNMSDFDALESKNDLRSKIDHAKKHGSISFKTIHKRKDGSAVLVHENVQYLKDKNLFKCIAREDYSVKK